MKINLLVGDSQPRSILASCQRRLNVYSELIDPKLDEPGQVIHYPTPGLRQLATVPNGKPLRGLYRASNGDLYGVAGFDVYYIDAKWVFHLIGTMMSTDVLHPTKMADNGVNVILCDGTKVTGYAINMATHSGLRPLYDPGASDALTNSSTGWLGSTFVDFSDGFFIANFIDTPSFYISNPQDTIFDPLQFAGKTAYPDDLVGAIVQHRVIWLIGKLATEVWYNSGGGATLGNTFPFELMPGVSIDWGCAAPYSIAKAETAIFWLAQNLNGEVVVLRGAGYTIQRVSTHAIEHDFAMYGDVSDCIAYCYMEEGHSFYVMNFPKADATWVYDLSTKQWHQRAYTDKNGEDHRQRASCHAYAYDTNIVNDWQKPNLYAMELATFQDNGQPIKRLISFPRQVNNDDDYRMVFRDFVAELDVGESRFPKDVPIIALSWSDDKGKTWSDALTQPIGRMGQYKTFVKWNRLGIARNRNFRLEWTANTLMALEGAWTNVIKSSA